MIKSSLVQVEEYLLTCMRYIDLNPVRANMVNDPAQYCWSIYRHNGLGLADERITPHPLYLELGKVEADRLAAYRALFRSELNDAALADIRLALAQGQPLGSGRFSEIMCAAVGVRRAQRRPGRPIVKHEHHVYLAVLQSLRKNNNRPIRMANFPRLKPGAVNAPRDPA